VATVTLGVLAVTDVVFLNIRGRTAELATIRTFGWRESVLARLVAAEELGRHRGRCTCRCNARALRGTEGGTSSPPCEENA
jgi:hypothetical protein